MASAKFNILTRSAKHPGLVATRRPTRRSCGIGTPPPSPRHCSRTGKNDGKKSSQPSASFEDLGQLAYRPRGPTEVVTGRQPAGRVKDHPEPSSSTCMTSSPARRMKLDRASYEQLHRRIGDEIESLRQALGAGRDDNHELAQELFPPARNARQAPMTSPSLSYRHWPPSFPEEKTSCPVFPHIVLRVQKVLADENATGTPASYVCSEASPVLASRIVRDGQFGGAQPGRRARHGSARCGRTSRPGLGSFGHHRFRSSAGWRDAELLKGAGGAARRVVAPQHTHCQPQLRHRA